MVIENLETNTIIALVSMVVIGIIGIYLFIKNNKVYKMLLRLINLCDDEKYSDQQSIILLKRLKNIKSYNKMVLSYKSIITLEKEAKEIIFKDIDEVKEK